MSKLQNILVINGHPDKESFNEVLAAAYTETLRSLKVPVHYLPLRDLQFDLNLRFGYRQPMELEPDLQQAVAAIRQSRHVVWIHPLWWYGWPALMKGFIDRLFLPGIAFDMQEDAITKKFAGRSARIICTGDTPEKDYEQVFASSAAVQLKKGTLAFCGFDPIDFSYFSPVYMATPEQKDRWVEEVRQLAKADALPVPAV